MRNRIAAQFARADEPIFAAIVSVGVQVAVIGTNLATGIITARYLGPSGRGIFSAVTMWPQLFAVLALSGIGNGVIFRMRNSGAPNRTFAASLVIIMMTTTVLVAIGMFLVPRMMRQYDPSVVVLAQICLLGSYTNSIQIVLKQVLAGVGAYWLYNVNSILPQIIYLAGLVLAVGLHRLSSDAAIASLVIGAVVSLVATLPSLLRIIRPNFEGLANEIRSLASYAGRAAPTDLVGSLAGNADRLILLPLIPPAQLGLYTVAFSFSRMILIIQPAISSVFFSSMSGRSPAEMKLLHDRALRLATPALVLGSAIMLTMDHWLLVAFFGSEFGAAVDMFRLLLIEAVIGCLAQISSQFYLSMNRPGLNSAMQVTSFIVSVVAVLILAPRFGAVGAAAGLLAGSTVRWLLLLANLKLSLNLSLPNPILSWSDLTFLYRKVRVH